MKNLIQLQKSYELQKRTFEEAKERRISNRQKQIEAIDTKISKLLETKRSLETANSQESEFESFDSFRKKAEEQSTKSLQSQET